MTRALIIIAALCVSLSYAEPLLAQGRVFNVSIRNKWNQNVRFKRMAEAKDDHAYADLAPNGTDTFRIRFDSDQVFMAWSNGRLLGMEKFSLEGSDGLGGVLLTIDERGRLSMAVSAR